jgi:hypothetical protein
MRVFLTFLFLLASAATGLTQKSDDKTGAHDDAAALTIYNQSFAVVRQTLPLDLKSGTSWKSLTSRRTWSRIRSFCAT